MTDRDYCERHNVDVSALAGWDRCPRCVREERVEAERRHRATRDRRVEPW